MNSKILFTLILCLSVATVVILIIYYKREKYRSPDIGNWGQVDTLMNLPDKDNANFNFKKQCREKGGVINLNNGMTASDSFSGTLLSCDKRGEYGSSENILFSEIDSIQSKIKSGEYSPKNERERLILYLSIVYPQSDLSIWNNMSLEELLAYYQDLEFYYKLPPEIMPQTKIIIHRSADKQFYRVPSGVILDQDPDRTGILTPYIEVVRFGPTYALMRDPQLFNGTYYYPAKGSGLYLPIGNTLIAYNKVHALKMLDVLNTQIVAVAGRDFQSFLQKDSDALWVEIKKKNPKADKKDYWVSACSVDKHATKQDPNCTPYLGAMTSKIWYIPQALDQMINEMVSGHSLRMDTRIQPDGKMKDVKVYYGLGDSGDKLMAQLARDRSYDTLQFLRESEMALEGDAVVGNEFLHLMEPIYSQESLLRLDPFMRPYIVSSDPFIQPRINYLLDTNIKPVRVDMIADGVYDPWEDDQIDINIVIPKRN